MYFFVLWLQIYFVYMTKTVISPIEVGHIRRQYSEYERIMYMDGEGVSHTYVDNRGFLRGKDGFFNETNFDEMDDQFRMNICQVPLSNQAFLFTILITWFILILSELRNTINLALRTAFGIAHRMSEKAQDFYDDDDTGIVFKEHPTDGRMIIMRVPLFTKVFIIVIVQVPRLIMTVYLGWLGARWLTATTNFANVMLNSLALVLIFEVGMIVFAAAVPYHTKVMVTSTFVPHLNAKEPENPCRVFGMFLTLVVAVAVTAAWMYRIPRNDALDSVTHVFMDDMRLHQEVLPQYNWDLKGVCGDYLKTMLDTGFHESTVETGGRGGKGR
jgi:hypothetical protein